MCAIIHQPRYVVFRHLGQLLLEYTFKARQDDKTLSCVVIVDHSKFDLTVALFFDSCLLFVVRVCLL